MTTDRPARLEALYAAFNARDLDAVLAAMSPDVDWPNGWQGGRVTGHEGVRRYWETQWREIRPHLRPTAVEERGDGTVEVRVHQVVRDPGGSILDVADVRHVHTFDDAGLVRRMDVEA